MKYSIRKKWNEMRGFVFFTLAITLLWGMEFAFADFYDSPCNSMKDFVGQAFQWGAIEMTTFVFIWMIAANKYVFAVAYPLLTALTSAVAFFRYTMKVTVTPMTIDLTFTNDLTTTSDMITLPLILFILINLIAAIFIARWRFRRLDNLKWQWIHIIVCMALIYGIFHNGRLGIPVSNRLPFNIYASLNEYLGNKRIVADKRPAFGGKTTCGTDSIDVVFIIGETLRADHMQINGYARPTTPLLAKEKNVVSLPNIESEYWFTHESVPYIMTRADHNTKDRAYTERSFIDIFKRAGYHTSWISNQESVPTFIYFMKEADKLTYVNGGKSLYIYDSWLDDDVLPPLDSALTNGKSNSRNLIVIHSIGSHWWYNAHYPKSAARWKPELTSRVITENSRQQFINSYDNTVLYSDSFWHQVRERLRHRNAIVIYLSDHGENLGEDGQYTHANDTKEVRNAACWIWCSDKYKSRYPEKYAALKRNAKKKYNTAFLFHSIIDAGDISTSYIDKKYDVFK